eukprot:TRINITY_DN3237_c0_g1_i5.p1 TRINITY_DN3237_c0_g1~~TRINITY_DN3237_c0_g1_i5.p1  ORF type:complete len:318 (+),score=63.28 TRINITY_DN3237_c0_g1_i5:129-1082(+)
MKIHNYNSLMAISLAFHMGTMVKIVEALKSYKPKSYSIWKRVKSLMSPKENFANYREHMQSVPLPHIPCQEVVLKDLLYNNEGSKDYIEEGVWNIKKLNLIGKIIEDFKRTQEKPFPFAKFDDLRRVLMNIPRNITSTILENRAADIESQTSVSPPQKLSKHPSMMLTFSESDASTDESSTSALTPKARPSTRGSMEFARRNSSESVSSPHSRSKESTSLTVPGSATKIVFSNGNEKSISQKKSKRHLKRPSEGIITTSTSASTDDTSISKSRDYSRDLEEVSPPESRDDGESDDSSETEDSRSDTVEIRKSKQKKS